MRGQTSRFLISPQKSISKKPNDHCTCSHAKNKGIPNLGCSPRLPIVIARTNASRCVNQHNPRHSLEHNRKSNSLHNRPVRRACGRRTRASAWRCQD